MKFDKFSEFQNTISDNPPPPFTESLYDTMRKEIDMWLSLKCQASLSAHINSKCKSGARYFLSLLFMKIHSSGPVIWWYVVRYLQSCFVMFNSCYLSLFKYFKINWSFYIAWKVSKYGVFSDPYFPVFGHFSHSFTLSFSF